MASGARRSRTSHALVQNVGLVLVIGLLAACIIGYCVLFVVTQHRFPGGFELTSTLDNTMPLAFAALAQTLVVLTRGIDLSVGGVIDLTNAVAAQTLTGGPVATTLWTLAILLIGAACGLVNGVLVAVGRLQPILVTLATLSIYQGIAIRVLPQPGGAIPPGFTAVLANPNWPTSLLYIPVIGGLWAIFRRTRLGVAVFAIGNDAMAASSHGISVKRTVILAYTLGGLASACAGLFLAANATAGDATTGDTYTLTSIVAAVLGGVSLFGGRGSGLGALFGAFVTVMVVNILFFAHIDPLYQTFYEGLFLLAAVVSANMIGRAVRGRR
ncbi:MAG: ABC transporter permease [Proteobacteria bacterium]|nr:ABC transporter permease [Pseudomonadota bacterium]